MTFPPISSAHRLDILSRSVDPVLFNAQRNMTLKRADEVLARYLASPIVKIIAGAERELLSVHVEALLSCNSPSLRTLISGGWKESHDGVIDWGHVDAKTVKRFLTFLYLGDYLAPDPTPIPSNDTCDLRPPSIEEIHQPEDVVDANAVHDDIAAVIESPPLEPDWPEESPPFIQNAIIATFEPRPLTPVSKCLNVGLPSERVQTGAGRLEDCAFSYSAYYYNETLLAHAQVYAFAQYHLVAELQCLALQQLTQVLGHIDCTQAHAISDLTPLIRYIYNNTVHDGSREEPIRKLASQFAAIHYTDLMKGEFEDFFSEGGDFALDVARKTSRRLAVSGGSAKSLEEQVDDLEGQIRSLRQVAEDRDGQLRILRSELAEWQSGERGISRKVKKKNYYH